MTSSARPVPRDQSSQLTVGFKGGGDVYDKFGERVRSDLADSRRHRRAQRRGSGPMLGAAGEVGTEALGVTLSPKQAAACRRNGLDARVQAATKEAL